MMRDDDVWGVHEFEPTAFVTGLATTFFPTWFAQVGKLGEGIA
jgi:hypothetical protein